MVDKCSWRGVLAVAVLAAAASFGEASGDEIPGLPKFTDPVRMKAGDEFVKVEAPGYAAPCWADIDGDGKKDLLVGQFLKGKLKFWRNLGEGRLASGQWLQADGEVAEVPGVW